MDAAADAAHLDPCPLDLGVCWERAVELVLDGKVVQVFLWATTPDVLQAAVIPLSVP